MNHHALMFPALLAVILPGCRASDSSSPDAVRAGEIQTGVRRMADSIAREVTADGPIAWIRYMEASPGFFMASGENLAFPNIDSAVTFVRGFAGGIRHIKLAWNDIRVDPLTSRIAVMGASFREAITDTADHRMRIGGYFTAVAEETPSGWRVRDMNWSMLDHLQ